MPSHAPPNARAERLTGAFVWGTWAAASAAALAFVLVYASNVPWMDDWELVPWLTGARPVKPGWVWRPQNDHRYPLTKLALVGLARLTGGDYRAAMVVCAVVLAAAAFLCIRTAARLRGRTAWTDAFFPLVMLHWGHAPNLLHHIQLLFVSAVGLALAVVLCLVRGSWRRSAGAAAALGALVVLLPLHGVMGLAFAPPFVLATAAAGVASGRAPSGWRRGLVLLCAALATTVLAAAYLAGFRRATMPAPDSLLDVLRTTGEVLAASLGPLGALAWPGSALALTALYLATGAVVVRAAWREPATRVEALGLLAAIAGGFAVAVAVGAGRAGFGPGRGLEARYAVLLLPLLAGVYFSWQLFGGRARPAAHALLFALACLSFAAGLEDGRAYGRERRSQGDVLVAAARAGLPPGLIAARYGEFFYPQRSRLTSRLELLRDARHGPYRGPLGAPAPSPCADWRPGTLRPTAIHDMDWADGAGLVTGHDPWVTFALPGEMTLCAVRLTIGHGFHGKRPPRLAVSWGRRRDGGWSGARLHNTPLAQPAGQPAAVVVWIDDTVDALRLAPESRARSLQLTRVEWMPRR